jgi:hypothetical protein
VDFNPRRARAPQRDNQHSRLRWWTTFALAATAMLYTHYLAAFLLLAYALFFSLALLLGWLQPRRRLLLEGSTAGVAVLIAYLPWLPNALRRFGEDASYWQGTLKFNEALRHIAISFTSGETVLEQQAIVLAWVVAGLAALCLVALLWAGFRDQTARQPAGQAGGNTTIHNSSNMPYRAAILFVLLYLLVPIAGILLLSYSNPKFNPRYLMLASPALILLLAGGFSLPFVSPIAVHRSRFTAHRLAHLLALGSLAVVLTIFLHADRNWFSDPAFTKDDWRSAVAHVRSQLQPDEAVVLVSGHAYPAWRYYAPDIEPVRLPAIETLDVNSVLSLDVAEQMNATLAGRRGAWLLQWQDEVVDPNGIVPFLLDTAGDAQAPAASFWGLDAPQHYRFSDAIRSEPGAPGVAFPVQLPLSAADQRREVRANFGGQVELVGYAQAACAQPLCPVYLFWRALQPLAADLKLTATLFGHADEIAWSPPLDRRLAAYDYPSFRWMPGDVVLSRMDIPADIGTPPGMYRLRLGVYNTATGEALDLLDASGAAQGRWAWLEPIAATALVTDGAGGPPQGSSPVQGAPEIALLGLRNDRTEVEPGEAVAIEAWWQATQAPRSDYNVSWQWVDSTGQARPGGWLAPAGLTYPTSQWQTDALVRSQFDIALPHDAEPGSWLLRIGLVGKAAGRNDADFAGATVDLPITVNSSARRFEPSAPFDIPSGADFSSQIELLGVRSDAFNATLQPGEVISLTVGWRALQRMGTTYTGFVHLLDDTGKVVAQDDHAPLQGQRPTTTWAAGEVVEDTFTLQLPATLPAGVYQIEIGLYDAGRPGLPRLKTSQGADSILLGEVAVGS